MKTTYDKGRRPIEIKVGDEVYIKVAKRIDEQRYRLLDNHIKLSFTKHGLYLVTERVSSLAFKVQLLD